MRPHFQPRRGRLEGQRGFSLIELMVTLTVMVVLLGIGVPSFRSFTDGQKVKSAASDLMASLVLARSEAVKRNSDVIIAPDTAGTWAGGWTVKSGTVTILQQQSMTGVTITDGATNIVYKANGRPGASPSFEITGGSSVRCVKVDSSGIPTAKSGACA